MFSFLKEILRFVFYKFIFPFIYSVNKRKVIENKIIFVEDKCPHVTSNFKLILEEIENNYNFDIRIHYLQTISISRVEYVKRATRLLIDMATAKYIFLNDSNNVVGAVNLRGETKCVQLWHACGAFKKFGFSTEGSTFRSNYAELKRYPPYRNLSLVTVSSSEVIWAYEEAMGINSNTGIVQAIGLSRTDVFFDSFFIQKAFEHLYDIFPRAKDKKIILYAPTFRGSVSNGQLDEFLDIKMFKDNLEENYVLINKYHPLVKNKIQIPEFCDVFTKDLTDLMSIEELLAISDICISDYSSLIFEFSLFEKPMIFFAYDFEEYNSSRGFYYPYKELLPGPIFHNNIDIINYIHSIDSSFDPTLIKNFKKKFMSSCDGQSTKRIIHTVFGDDINKYKR